MFYAKFDSVVDQYQYPRDTRILWRIHCNYCNGEIKLRVICYSLRLLHQKHKQVTLFGHCKFVEF